MSSTSVKASFLNSTIGFFSRIPAATDALFQVRPAKASASFHCESDHVKNEQRSSQSMMVRAEQLLFFFVALLKRFSRGGRKLDRGERPRFFGPRRRHVDATTARCLSAGIAWRSIDRDGFARQTVQRDRAQIFRDAQHVGADGPCLPEPSANRRKLSRAAVFFFIHRHIEQVICARRSFLARDGCL